MVDYCDEVTRKKRPTHCEKTVRSRRGKKETSEVNYQSHLEEKGRGEIAPG